MAERSRRSFFADLLTTVAGGWVTVTGLVTAASALSGCSDDTATPKYGGPNPDLVMKYGGPDLGPVVKYGGTDALVTKYGGYPG